MAAAAGDGSAGQYSCSYGTISASVEAFESGAENGSVDAFGKW